MRRLWILLAVCLALPGTMTASAAGNETKSTAPKPPSQAGNRADAASPIAGYPVTKGAYVDRGGARHAWYISQAHTLYWDGKPWYPVGGMYCPPYATESNDSGWAMTTAQLDLLKEKGIIDLYIHFAGPDYISPEKLQRVIDALDERGFRYGVEITTNPEAGPAWCISGCPTTAVTGDSSGNARAKAECKGASQALYVAVSEADGSVLSSGKATLSGDFAEAAFDLPAGQSARVRFIPERSADPFFWDGHYGAYEKRILDYYAKIKLGAGFRFVVDPLMNELQIDPAQIPASPDYARSFSTWLTKRYGSMDKLAQAWALKGEVKSIEEAAALIPAWSGDGKGPALLTDPATGKTISLDLAASQCWYDHVQFHGEEARDYCGRIADAFKQKVADVPVILKHAGPISRHRLADAGGMGGIDGIGMEPYGAGETAQLMNAAVCLSEAEQASKTTWLVVTETSEATFENQLENIGYMDRMGAYQQLSTLLSSGAKGIFLFGLSFGANPGQFWMSEFLRDPRQLEWMGAFRRILENAPALAEYRPTAYYRFPASEPGRKGFHAAEPDFVGLDGDWTGLNGQGGRSIERASNGTWILPTLKADIETPLLVANLENAPASTRWGAELEKRISQNKWTAYIGFRKDRGAIPSLDRYFSDHFVTDASGLRIQALNPIGDAQVLARGSDGSIWNMVVGNLQIVSREVPDKEGWQPNMLVLPQSAPFPSPEEFMRNVLGCSLVDSQAARAVSFHDAGVQTSYLWSLDKKGFRIPVGGIKAPAKIEYPDGSPVSTEDNKILVPLEETPALVETPVPYIRGKHYDTRNLRDAVVFRSLGILPPVQAEEPNIAELEAETNTGSNWNWGRFGGLTRLSENGMWVLDTYVDPSRFESYSLRYQFQWKASQKLHLWVREAVGGSPCRWRVNMGAWNEVPADVKDEDKQFVAPWTPFGDARLYFAWHDYGVAEISADNNLLEIEVLAKRPKGDKYSKFVDKLILAPEGFTPKGKGF